MVGDHYSLKIVFSHFLILSFLRLSVGWIITLQIKERPRCTLCCNYSFSYSRAHKHLNIQLKDTRPFKTSINHFVWALFQAPNALCGTASQRPVLSPAQPNPVSWASNLLLNTLLSNAKDLYFNLCITVQYDPVFP